MDELNLTRKAYHLFLNGRFAQTEEEGGNPI